MHRRVRPAAKSIGDGEMPRTGAYRLRYGWAAQRAGRRGDGAPRRDAAG